MKLLATTDGSEDAKRAIERAGELAQALGADVLVLTVSRPLSFAVYGPVVLLDEGMHEDPPRQEAEAFLEEAAALLRRRGVAVETLWLKGHPADRIVETARQRAIDLIVIGAHGRSRIERFLMGSVSSQVVAHAPCSVLVVKPPNEPLPS